MAAPALPSSWPAQPDPKTLMCVRVPCKVAELFRILFGSSELQVRSCMQSSGRRDAALVAYGFASCIVSTPHLPDTGVDVAEVTNMQS